MNKDKSFYRMLIYAFSLLVLWNVMILLSPLLLTSDNRFFQYLGSSIYFLMDPVCHQLAERSLFIGKVPLPVCARCTFIYLAGLVVIVVPLLRQKFKPWPPKIYVLPAFIVGLEIFSEKLHFIHNLTELRLLSGLLLGMLIFRLILEGIYNGNRKQKNG